MSSQMVNRGLDDDALAQSLQAVNAWGTELNVPDLCVDLVLWANLNINSVLLSVLFLLDRTRPGSTVSRISQVFYSTLDFLPILFQLSLLPSAGTEATGLQETSSRGG